MTSPLLENAEITDAGVVAASLCARWGSKWRVRIVRSWHHIFIYLFIVNLYSTASSVSKKWARRFSSCMQQRGWWAVVVHTGEENCSEPASARRRCRRIRVGHMNRTQNPKQKERMDVDTRREWTKNIACDKGIRTQKSIFRKLKKLTFKLWIDASTCSCRPLIPKKSKQQKLTSCAK